MSKIIGTTILDTIVPPNTASIFPTHDSVYGKGGWRELDNWNQVALIPRDRMRVGMAVFIVGEGPFILYSMGSESSEDVWKPIQGEKGDPGTVGPAGSINNFVVLTEAEYNSLPVKELNIIYCLYDTGNYQEDSDAEVLNKLLVLNAEIDEISMEVSGEIEDNLLIL